MEPNIDHEIALDPPPPADVHEACTHGARLGAEPTAAETARRHRLGNRLAAVEVRGDGDRLDVSLPTELFDIQGLQGTGLDDYAPSADGRRFLVKQSVEQGREPRLQIITNWTSLLE